MNEIMMYIMAAGAVLGGLDHIFGSRLGLGKRFEEGFMLLGPTALSMAGIICLAPLLAGSLESAIVPVWSHLGLAPGMLGSILAIDMGGYQLAMSLAHAPEVGRYAGIIMGATFGCTISFTIPVGMGMLDEPDRPHFARGILLGLGAMPIALVAGGLFSGLTLTQTLLESLPIFLLSVLLMLGIGKWPRKALRCFGLFAALIRILAIIGLILGAVTYMTGKTVIPGIAPIEEAMAVVTSIGVVMLGSLPVAELLQRALRTPLHWIGKKTGLNGNSVAGLLMGIVSPMPVIATLSKMDTRGKIVNGAFLVCGASALAAHMGFAFGVEQTMVISLLISKLFGGLAGAGVALFVTRKKKEV